VFLHHTPYSCANGIASIGSDLTVRNGWGPLFEQYGVDVVFDGHDHSYERSKTVDDFLVGGAGGHDGLGTIYVMSGGGGASLDGAAKRGWRAARTASRCSAARPTALGSPTSVPTASAASTAASPASSTSTCECRTTR
jgi:hypothetical protein